MIISVVFLQKFKITGKKKKRGEGRGELEELKNYISSNPLGKDLTEFGARPYIHYVVRDCEILFQFAMRMQLGFDEKPHEGQ